MCLGQGPRRNERGGACQMASSWRRAQAQGRSTDCCIPSGTRGKTTTRHVWGQAATVTSHRLPRRSDRSCLGTRPLCGTGGRRSRWLKGFKGMAMYSYEPTGNGRALARGQVGRVYHRPMGGGGGVGFRRIACASRVLHVLHDLVVQSVEGLFYVESWRHSATSPAGCWRMLLTSHLKDFIASA